MATRAEREVKHANHEQELTAVRRAAHAAREQERQRTERENETNAAHESMLEQSQRAHFLSSHDCP